MTPSVHPGIRGRRSGANARARARVTSVRSRTMLSKPLACPSTLDHRDSGVLRGGALEPGARRGFGKCAGKSRSVFSSEFCCAESAGGSFSLRRGLGSVLNISSWASPSRCVDRVPDTTKATLSGRPRSSSHTAKRLARRPLRKGRRCHGPALIAGLCPNETGAAFAASARIIVLVVCVMSRCTLDEASDARKFPFEVLTCCECTT